MAEKEKINPNAYTALAASNGQVIHQSDDLFQGEKSIIIQHQNEYYILRITKSGKLILTK